MKTLTPRKRSLRAAAREVLQAPPAVPDGRRIGLLGGSFNPAHEGHLEISRLALDLLALDEVWWLVTPQNPLKTEAGMAPLADRLRAAKAAARGESIHVTDLEAGFDSRYTADTLRVLTERYPGAHFVWLMGADNLVQMHRWRRWSSIFHTVPVAVFARPTYSLRAERSKAARRFARSRVKTYRAGSLATRRPPAWVLFKRPLNPVSATELRSREPAAE